MHLGQADRARTADDFRKNPRKIWWHNLKEVTINGDHEVTFDLGRPQPSFLSLLASGYYAGLSLPRVGDATCAPSRSAPGPFKFVEFKRNESIKLVRNPDYWKKGQPYLDAIDWTRHRQPLARACWPSSPASST